MCSLQWIGQCDLAFCGPIHTCGLSPQLQPHEQGSPAGASSLSSIRSCLALTVISYFYTCGALAPLQAVTADVSIAMSLGSLVTYFQLIALFSEIGFDWSTEVGASSKHVTAPCMSQVSTLLDLAKLSLFNFDILRLACFMEGPHQSLWRYLAGLVLPYGIIMSALEGSWQESTEYTFDSIHIVEVLTSKIFAHLL